MFKNLLFKQVGERSAISVDLASRPQPYWFFVPHEQFLSPHRVWLGVFSFTSENQVDVMQLVIGPISIMYGRMRDVV